MAGCTGSGEKIQASCGFQRIRVSWPRATSSTSIRTSSLRCLFHQDVLQRYITALGGTLKLIVDFGDEQLKIA